MKRNNQYQIRINFLVLYLLLLLLPVSVFAQNGNPSSRSKKPNTLSQDTAQINQLNNQALRNINANSLEDGIKLAEEALNISQASDYKIGMAQAYQSIGKYYYFSNIYRKAIEHYQYAYEQWKLLGDSSKMARQSNYIGSMYREMAVYDTALLYFSNSLKLLEHLNDSIELANTYSKIGLIYNSQGDFNKSLENLLESLRLWQCTNNEVEMGLTYCNIGMVYRRLGEYEKALDYLQKTLDIEDKLEMPRQIIESYIQIGIIYEETGEYEKAISNYHKGLKIAREQNYKKKIAGCLNNIGVVYYNLRDFNMALDYYFKSLEIKREIGDKHGITVTTINIAEAYLDLSQSNLQSNPDNVVKYFGSLDKIISMLKESTKMAEETSNFQDLTNAYYALISVYSESDNFKEAVLYQEKLMALTDSLFSIAKNREIAKLAAKLEINQKEQEIALMDAKNIAQIAQLKRQNSRRYIFLGGGISLMLIIVGLFNRLVFMRNSQKQLQAKNLHIQHEKDKAEQSEKIKEQFLANMSHEIRTPMNSILGMTNILRKNQHLKTQEKYLDAIAQSSDNLMVILNDIIDLSKLESGKIELEHKLFNLNDELRSIEDILKFKAKEKGIKLKCEMMEGVPEWIIGDSTRLNQVMINLVGNAIKFTEKGGVSGLVRVKELKESQAILEFVIRDSGIGISPDRLDAVFHSFTQADGNTTRHYGGTGLGLTISKQLVELQNGEISVESELGKGSSFSFYIPYEIGKSPLSEQSEKIIEYPKLNGVRVLVAEDNEFNAMVLLEELSSNIQNGIIDIANDGKIAVDNLMTNSYDIILMDIQMPEMDGYAAAKAVRNLDASKNGIPIIAMTASTMKSDIDKCFESGMDAFISKPFETGDLLGKMEQLIEKNN